MTPPVLVSFPHKTNNHVDWLIFSITELNFEIADKLSPLSNMSSSRSEENINLRHFQPQDGVTVLVSPAILLDSCDFLLLWQMFSPLLYGTVMFVWQMLLPCCHMNATFCFCLADVIAWLHYWLR